MERAAPSPNSPCNPDRIQMKRSHSIAFPMVRRTRGYMMLKMCRATAKKCLWINNALLS